MAVVRLIRLFALGVSLSAAAMALYRGLETGRFVSAAHHAIGHVSGTATDGKAEIEFRAENGNTETLAADLTPVEAALSSIDILYVRSATSLDARVADDRTLWAPMWTWIETALAAMLLAIYGRALIEDPLSVIGFKSWRRR